MKFEAVLRDMLEGQGWALAPAERMCLFVGRAVKDEVAIIEASTCQSLTERWMLEFGLAATRRWNEICWPCAIVMRRRVRCMRTMPCEGLALPIYLRTWPTCLFVLI